MAWPKILLKELTEDLTEKRKVSIDDNEEVSEPTIVTKEHKIITRSIKKGSQLKIKERILIKKGDLVFSRLHTQNGAFAFSDQEFKSTTTFLPLKIDEEKIDKNYLFWVLHLLVPELKASDTVGRETYKSRDILNLEIPLPPLKEQNRIIKKFLSFKDKISNSQSEINLDLEFINQLCQQILQEAVQGKLVKQDPNDEPASELLKKIKAEKEKLIKEGKSRKEKTLVPISEEEVPYELPKGWEWTRLGEVGITQTGFTPSTSNSSYFGNYIPFIGPGDISNNKIDYSNKGLSKLGSEQGRIISRNSILMVCIGGSIGKAIIIDRDVTCNQQINTITNLGDISSRYIFIALTSPIFQEKILLNSTGSATPIINKAKWESIPVPLPPLAEQKRIVEKVDKLIAYCDELEKQVKENQVNSEKLMGAVLKESFESEKPGIKSEKELIYFLKLNGREWQLYNNDKDPLPSRPHLHDKFSGQKLNVYTGELYDPRIKKIVGKLTNKELNGILDDYFKHSGKDIRTLMRA